MKRISQSYEQNIWQLYYKKDFFNGHVSVHLSKVICHDDYNLHDVDFWKALKCHVTLLNLIQEPYLTRYII